MPYSVAISDELQKLELMNQPKSLVEAVRIFHRLENARKTVLSGFVPTVEKIKVCWCCMIRRDSWAQGAPGTRSWNEWRRSKKEDSWAGKKTWNDFDRAARNEVVNARTVRPVLCHYCFATVCKKINNQFHVMLRFRNIVSKDTFSLSFTRHSFCRSFFSMAFLWHTQQRKTGSS